MRRTKTAVVALGGNAITRPDQEDTIANQFANTRKSLDAIVDLVRDGFDLVITHGNGPQVGNALLRTELARDKAPYLPLGILVADTQGGMGYMIEQSLQNRLRAENIHRPVLTVITQMLVDKNDPAIDNPTKYIGRFYSKDDARRFIEELGWEMKQDGDRGWRRVVPSPEPMQAVPATTIRHLMDRGVIVIAAGGGGIPVYIDADGRYEGMDAVIDKDRASAVLAANIDAEILAILTSVDGAAIHYGQENQQMLERVSLADIKKYHAEGHFPPGSMGPKIEAAIHFLESGGKMVVVASLEEGRDAIHDKAGTRIVAE